MSEEPPTPKQSTRAVNLEQRVRQIETDAFVKVKRIVKQLVRSGSAAVIRPLQSQG